VALKPQAWQVQKLQKSYRHVGVFKVAQKLPALRCHNQCGLKLPYAAILKIARFVVVVTNGTLQRTLHDDCSIRHAWLAISPGHRLCWACAYIVGRITFVLHTLEVAVEPIYHVVCPARRTGDTILF